MLRRVRPLFAQDSEQTELLRRAGHFSLRNLNQLIVRSLFVKDSEQTELLRRVRSLFAQDFEPTDCLVAQDCSCAVGRFLAQDSEPRNRSGAFGRFAHKILNQQIVRVRLIAHRPIRSISLGLDCHPPRFTLKNHNLSSSSAAKSLGQ